MASHWLASGIKPKAVSERLGARQCGIYLAGICPCFAHALPNQQGEGAERVAGVILGKQALNDTCIE